jgi:molecular chaperone GrpE
VQELNDEPTLVEHEDIPAEAPEKDPIVELTTAVTSLTEEIRAHHARAAARERVIDNLHAEVERLRAGERNLALRPITTDLQHIRNDLLRQAAGLPTEVRRDQVVDLLESFALSVEQTLERCGIVPLRPETGSEFAGRQHRAMKVLSTFNPELDGTIAEVTTDGYLDTTTDRVTDPARVNVWRWEAESTPEEKAEDG